MNIDELSKQFKTMKELRQYCDSQYMVINQLNKKIIEQDQEIAHLKEVLSNSAPIISDASGDLEVYKDISDELLVCIQQIKILRNKSEREELTFEEAKKLDIYTKLLVSLRTGKEPKKNEVTPSVEELEKILKEVE